MTRIRDGKIIKILAETREKLKALGKKGETYDSVLNRLMDAYSQKKSPQPA